MSQVNQEVDLLVIEDEMLAEVGGGVDANTI